MILTRKYLGAALSLVLVSAGSMGFAEDSDLVARGEYIARAGDCAACHTTGNGKAFAGGYAFHMPMGTIYSSNITPSQEFGIGGWSEEAFARAVRKGVRPDGTHLYPAMPYTAYATVTDEDMQALYAYFMERVEPVDEAAVQQTELEFPFNMPGTMAAWNLLFARGKPFTPDPNLTDAQNRGKYLADGLAHCSTCHTPRNALMAEKGGSYLAGGTVDGWFAPNITSDHISGVGGWSDDELATYLRNGHVEGKGQAGGPMADAVENSFRFLTDDDAHAIAAYLKTVPPIREQGQTIPDYAVTKAQPVDWTSFESSPNLSDTPQHIDDSTTDGALLYNVNCAACHGISGQGSDDHYFPSLTQNSAVGSANPQNLVMVMVDGIHREGADGKAVMPAFAPENQVIHTRLSNDQIASVANYVSATFGAGGAGLTGADVSTIRSGGEAPFLIRHAATLAIIGMVCAALVLVGGIVLLLRRRYRRN